MKLPLALVGQEIFLGEKKTICPALFYSNFNSNRSIKSDHLKMRYDIKYRAFLALRGPKIQNKSYYTTPGAQGDCLIQARLNTFSRRGEKLPKGRREGKFDILLVYEQFRFMPQSTQKCED